ncbi:ABC-type phosphate transport system permease subunit [Pseudomonas sp. IT-194MI4]
MWQVVASVQQTVALLSTEQPFEPDVVRLSRKKRRDVASFGGVLEALTGQTFLICTFIVRGVIPGCVSGALFRY